jgi:Zn-dependent M16 (insulinase) family peptidase
METILELLSQSEHFNEDSILFGLKGMFTEDQKNCVLEDTLQLLAESQNEEILNLSFSLLQKMVDSGRKDEMVRAGSLNALLLALSKNPTIDSVSSCLKLIHSSIMDGIRS